MQLHNFSSGHWAEIQANESLVKPTFFTPGCELPKVRLFILHMGYN